MPLANDSRPTVLDEVKGQKHILAPGKILYNLIQNKYQGNYIFYGPPGTGKTTLATLISKGLNKEIVFLNGITAKSDDLKACTGRNGILLYLDEIQYMNKKQQQLLLQATEAGTLQLIASTTENPYFTIYPALLSRSMVFEFKKLDTQALREILEDTCTKHQITIDSNVLTTIAEHANGDARKALNILEAIKDIPDPDVRELSGNNLGGRGDDEMYDLASGLMKSMRGSDPDASVYYLSRLLVNGDLLTPIRRILCSASEDIGLADPSVAVKVKAYVDTALQLGLPEARIPLSCAAILCAISPKSNAAYQAVNEAMHDIEKGLAYPPPRELQNKHCDSSGLERDQGYQYPHDFTNHWVKQAYMPEELRGKKYYTPQSQYEEEIQKYWNWVKGM